MAKVVNRASDIIQLKDLKDGEFAEVIEWFEDGTVSNGDIIQRCGLALFILGSCSYYLRYLVRVLETILILSYGHYLRVQL